MCCYFIIISLLSTRTHTTNTHKEYVSVKEQRSALHYRTALRQNGLFEPKELQFVVVVRFGRIVRVPQHRVFRSGILCVWYVYLREFFPERVCMCLLKVKTLKFKSYNPKRNINNY